MQKEGRTDMTKLVVAFRLIATVLTDALNERRASTFRGKQSKGTGHGVTSQKIGNFVSLTVGITNLAFYTTTRLHILGLLFP
jgi:hypothetical protein